MFRIQEDDPKLTFCNGTVLHKNQVRFSFGDWFQGILELSRNLHQMEIDMSAFSCLAALSLVYGKYCAHGCLLRWYLSKGCNFFSLNYYLTILNSSDVNQCLEDA